MKKLAIIGFGPRGLHALECLCKELAEKNKSCKITIFENRNEYGTSFVWDTKQPDSNWVNISERGLKNLKGRDKIKFKNFEIEKFPSYHTWNKNQFSILENKDAFPARNKIGTYLKERANSLISILKQEKVISIIQSLITDIDLNNTKVILKDIKDKSFNFDEILLTIGHQTTSLDKDIKKYQKQSLKGKNTLLESTYPTENLIHSKHINTNTTIAIRGFGLAMIDAVRALTIERGADFKITDATILTSKFVANKKIPRKIIPYSLDGLPVVPKPLNKEIDGIFSPSKKQLKKFKDCVLNVAKGKTEVEDSLFLKNILAEISAEIYVEYKQDNELTLKETKELILLWFNNSNFKHPLIQDSEINTLTLLESYAYMACNKKEISLDYFVGQVIRQCQPTLYKAFSHAKISEDIIAEVIKFDEKMKRYSYGPPVESIWQLVALQKAAILDFNFVKNPTIEFQKNTWMFQKNENKENVDVIINSVLDSPKILEVDSPIVLNLLKNKIINPIHSKLGIHTKENGIIVNDNKDKELPIAVLGRLAKGSVIGVDAILECFGPRIKDWAKGCANRL